MLVWNDSDVTQICPCRLSVLKPQNINWKYNEELSSITNL